MDSKVVCFLALAAVLETAQAAEFSSNHLFVVNAQASSEAVAELDYTIVETSGAVNASSTVRSIGSSTDLLAPQGCAFSPDGKLYVVTADPGTPSQSRVLVYGQDGALVGSPITSVGMNSARGIAFGPDGHFYVAASATSVVMEFNENGTFVKNIGIGAGMVEPTGIAVGPNGNLFITDASANKIYEFTTLQSVSPVRTISNAALNSPWGCCFGPRGHLFVVNNGANDVLEFDENGNLVLTIGAISTLNQPQYIALGFDSNLYVTSNGSSRIVVFDGDETPSGQPNQQIEVIGGTASVTLAGPTGIAFSPQRFGVNITGKLYEASKLKATLNQTYKNNSGPVISWAPGTRFAMMTLVDTASTSDLVSAFGSDHYVFNGFQTTQDVQNDARAFAGVMIPAPNFESGSATLVLDIAGKVNAEDQFLTKSFSGKIIIQARNAIYQGKVTFVKEVK